MPRLSAVIELLDGYREKPALGARPRFLLNRLPVAPREKPQARYVLLDLVPGNYVLEVLTDAFKPCRLEFALRDEACMLSERWLPCVLEPGERYVYPATTTAIRGRLGGIPAGEAVISASYCSAHGRPRQAQIRCTRDQAFTLVLPGKLADPTPVTLRVNLGGGVSEERAMLVRPGSMHRLGQLWSSIESTS